MLYREVGQYKSNYAADMAVFPILQDRIGIIVILVIAYVVFPLIGNNFLLNTILIPFLIFSLAAIGLNLLTGYTGLLSLGTGAFMGVGAYACLKLTTIFPHVNILIWILVSGFFSSAIGVLFGLPSLRIKGFYLAVATLAAQFFLEWCFIRIPWLYNYSVSGAIEVPLRTFMGVPITGPTATSLTRYFAVLTIVVGMTWVASNLVHGRIGRMWMSVRDMDLAAELIGIRLLRAKLLGVRRIVVLLRRGRRDDGVPVVWRRRSRSVRHRPKLPHPFHGDYRRPWHPDRSVFRLGADLHSADRVAAHSGQLRRSDPSGRSRATDLRDRWRADHRVFGGRAQRARAAVADR